ncbi:hypothetical protein EVAR_5452_1 [Eumeta japonica]|uniref:Uncharacterized protein n=1 Tax=Eumeta variegata TaxID=151549 RepID=A0A4C1T8W6_EUMVA|nr:hypothetical protein EVAR_5452_1 [Eumeta japonica]
MTRWPSLAKFSPSAAGVVESLGQREQRVDEVGVSFPVSESSSGPVVLHLLTPPSSPHFPLYQRIPICVTYRIPTQKAGNTVVARVTRRVRAYLWAVMTTWCHRRPCIPTRHEHQKVGTKPESGLDRDEIKDEERDRNHDEHILTS